MMGRPPTSSSAFFTPPSRVPSPPAKMMLVISAMAAILLAAKPTTALAHVKWFEDPSRYPLQIELLPSERTALFIGVAALAVGLLYLAQRVVGDPHWPHFGFFQTMAIGAPALLAVQSAIALVHAAVQPSLLAANLRLALDPLGLGLALIMILVAFSVITGLGDWAGALALMLLVAATFVLFPPLDALSQLHWAGIGLFILIVGRPAVSVGQLRPWFARRNAAWSARAVAALRMITGISILAPALDEKIWNPAIGAAFLASHPQFNFVRTFLGQSWFTDDLFVLAAGIAEGVIGVLLISGLLTRVVIMGMWVPFNVTIPFLPATELLGHLPIFGIMYLLLVHSSGIAPGESIHRQMAPGTPRASIGNSQEGLTGDTQAA
jgi:hypothetical protein